MTPIRKYQVLLAATVLGFLYLLCTEVLDRYAETLSLYSELRSKEQEVREPEVVEAERASLLERKMSVKAAIRARVGVYEESLTGVLEFVNASAKSSGVRLDALTPERAPGANARRGATGFKMTLLAPFHKVGRFVNELETGPFALRVSKLELTREPALGGLIKATCEGTVVLAP